MDGVIQRITMKIETIMDAYGKTRQYVDYYHRQDELNDPMGTEKKFQKRLRQSVTFRDRIMKDTKSNRKRWDGKNETEEIYPE